MKRAWGITLVVLTIAWWGWFGFRALALSTGRLGSVSINWSPGQSSTTFARWTPRASDYDFDQDRLRLAPQSTTQFIVTVPKRFRYFRVSLEGRPGLSLDDENRDPAQRSTEPNTTRRFDRRAIVPVSGGYRLTIRNLGTESITVERIKISFIP